MREPVDKEPNPWHPMTDSVDLKHLGKLTEECGELASAAARCMIQGIDECHPITGKSNREWLEEELADVLANINLVHQHFKLNGAYISTRSGEKQIQLRKWHKLA